MPNFTVFAIVVLQSRVQKQVAQTVYISPAAPLGTVQTPESVQIELSNRAIEQYEYDRAHWGSGNLIF